MRDAWDHKTEFNFGNISSSTSFSEEPFGPDELQPLSNFGPTHLARTPPLI